MLLFNENKLYVSSWTDDLKTSYVIVQLDTRKKYSLTQKDLKTSYVIVQHVWIVKKLQ